MVLQPTVRSTTPIPHLSPCATPSAQLQAEGLARATNQHMDATLTCHACPPSVLSTIAAAAGVSPSALSTVSIFPAAYTLTRALVKYAVKYGESRDLRMPVLVEGAFFPSSSSSDTDSDSSANNSVSGLGNNDEQNIDDQELALLEQNRRASIPTPAFELGLGTVSVVWPPPEAVSAAKLAEDERRNQQNSASSSSRNRYRPASSRYDENGTIRHHRRIFAATTEPQSKLHTFLTNVIVWNFERSPLEVPKQPKPSYHELYRYKASGDSGVWEQEGDRRSRSSSSVFLENNQMDTILSDLRRFLKPETVRWYRRHGLPQRRSYLFFGPPGTGKTSTIRVLASQFRRTCCFLSMTNGAISNEALGDALETLPRHPIIVLEDVDALFVNRRSKSNSLTFSGLLNALDGVLSVEGVITVMTTNHIDKLDDALLRAGRIDRRFYFGPPSNEVIGKVFKTFYPDADEEVIESFIQVVSNRPAKDKARSIATLQLLFIEKREASAKECVESVDSFFDTYFPMESDSYNTVADKEDVRGSSQAGKEQGSDSDNDRDDGSTFANESDNESDSAYSRSDDKEVEAASHASVKQND